MSGTFLSVNLLISESVNRSISFGGTEQVEEPAGADDLDAVKGGDRPEMLRVAGDQELGVSRQRALEDAMIGIVRRTPPIACLGLSTSNPRS